MANTKITNRVLDTTVITGQSAVTVADGDYILVSDASDSNALKKVLASDLIQSSEEIADIVGAMVSSNTESGITVAYEDSDNTIDFTIGTLNQNTTGSAATLTTARTIGGTSFDGSANIAVGLAATATALATSRTIHGVGFDGTANIDLSEVISDTVGAMFSSNTETNITVTYQDSDNTIDLVVDAAQPNVTSLGTLTTLTVDDITINGSTISDGGDLTLDIGGDLLIDVDGTEVKLSDNGDQFGTISVVNGNLSVSGSDADHAGLIMATHAILPGEAAAEASGNVIDLGANGNEFKSLYLNTSIITDSDLTLDVGGDIILDADGSNILFKDAATTRFEFFLDSSPQIKATGGTFDLENLTQDADIRINGNDGGSVITALRLDMSDAGAATFNDKIIATELDISGNVDIDGTTNLDAVDIDGAVNMATTLLVTGIATAATSAKITQVAITSSSNAVAWDSAAAANAYHVTTENTTFSAPSNAVEGAIISVELAQGGTPRTIAWNTVFEFAASTAPTVTATANKTDIFAFRYNGSVWQEIGRVQNMAQT